MLNRNSLPILVCLLTLTATVFGLVFDVSGQEVVDWSVPTNISNSPTKSHHQYIIADDYGYVHVFWVEDVGGPRITKDNQGGPGNTIYYRRWDGVFWSSPVDIFFSRGGSLSYPTAAIDNDGRLFLIWVSNDGIHFSSAPAQDALSTKDWEPDYVISPAQGSRPALLANGSGELDLIFDTAYRFGDTGKDGNIYYIQSNDSGQTWSAPLRISSVDPSSETIAAFPRLIRDGNNRLHVAWYQANPPAFIGDAVYYSRSIDEGGSWSQPLLVDSLTPGENWTTTINIGVVGMDEIHLVWVCGRLPGRCHQWSPDGGMTWTPASHLFGDLHSRANWDAMATDAEGNLYWILQLRYPYALYYTYWERDHWVDPPLILHYQDPLVSAGHGVQLTISSGNQLHLVVHNPEVYEIWHIWGSSALAQVRENLPTPLIPSAVPTSVPSTRLLNQSNIGLDRTTEPLFPQDEPRTITNNPMDIMLSGIIPTLLFLSMVAIYRFVLRKE